MPRTVLPTNLQYFVPRVIEIRMDPCDRLGIFIDTAAAIFAAVVLLFLRRRNDFTVEVLLEFNEVG
jgi:hypothetical protein